MLVGGRGAYSNIQGTKPVVQDKFKYFLFFILLFPFSLRAACVSRACGVYIDMGREQEVTANYIGVLHDITEERINQVSQGYDRDHDEAHGTSHLVGIAQNYLWSVNSDDDEDSFAKLLKATTTLVAALEVLRAR